MCEKCDRMDRESVERVMRIILRRCMTEGMSILDATEAQRAEAIERMREQHAQVLANPALSPTPGFVPPLAEIEKQVHAYMDEARETLIERFEESKKRLNAIRVV